MKILARGEIETVGGGYMYSEDYPIQSFPFEGIFQVIDYANIGSAGFRLGGTVAEIGGTSSGIEITPTFGYSGPFLDHEGGG